MDAVVCTYATKLWCSIGFIQVVTTNTLANIVPLSTTEKERGGENPMNEWITHLLVITSTCVVDHLWASVSRGVSLRKSGEAFVQIW